MLHKYLEGKMRTTKKYAAIALVFTIILSFYACVRQPGDPAQATSSTPAVSGIIPETYDTKEESNDTAKDETGGNTKMKVLFLGNSLVYYNNMPLIFESLTKSSGKDVFVDSVTQGSATMSLFADKTTGIGASAYSKLTNEKWDYVIIEPSRRITPYENTVLEAEIAAAKVLSDLAKAAGARVLLYSVWGNNDGSLTVYKATSATDTQQLQTESITHMKHTAFMRSASEKVSEAIGGAAIIDAGYAFENVMSKNPEINLYDPDLRHPSLEGSYLVACTIFSTIYGEKNEGNGYTANVATAGILQKAADDTVLNKLVPNLTEIIENTDKEFNLLVIGSNLLDNYAMLPILGKIMKETDGVTLNSVSYLDDTFVFAMLADESTDLGVRKALKEKNWDAIIIQLSRRNSISAADVAQNETASLEKIMPLFLAETSDVYILTLNSSSNPAIFSAANNIKNYDKTAKSETCTAAEGTAYFSRLASDMASTLGCKTILYGEAYHKLSPATKENTGYLQACCLYYTLFGREIPGTTTMRNGLSAEEAEKVRSYAKEVCIK